MYEEHVLEHYAKPYHKGPMREVLEGSSMSSVCGDAIVVRAYIIDGVIADIWWEGEGCCFSQAAASMLVQHADGKTVDDMRDFRESEMFELFRAEYPDARRGCILVSLQALRKLLETYR